MKQRLLNQRNLTRRLQLLLVSLVMLLPLNGWGQTSYDLWIGGIDEEEGVWGTQVTADNADDILAVWDKDHQGMMSFDEEKHILTISNVGDLPFGVVCGLDELTIKFSGENAFFPEVGAAITYLGNGEGTLTLVKDEQATVCALDLRTVAQNQAAISGFSSLSYQGFYLHSEAGGVMYDVSTKKLQDASGAPVGAVKFSTVEAYYDLWYRYGDDLIQVTSLNQNNITGEENLQGEPQAAFRYDPDTKRDILTLNNANISGGFVSSLPNLTIDLMGNNAISSGDYPIFQSGSGDAVNMTFQSSPTVKGSLYMSNVNHETSNFVNDNVNLTLSAPLSVISGSLTGDYNATIGVDYGITITAASGSYPITSVSRKNVLNDSEGEETVQFDGDKTLILNGATLQSINIATQHEIQELVIYLKGNNTINNNDNNGIIYGGDPNLPLTYATGDGSSASCQPGTLECSYYVEDSEHPEVTNIYDNFSSVSYYNNLSENQNTTDHKIKIAIPLPPIVTAEQKAAVRAGIGEAIEGVTKSQLTNGVLVNKVLYTLPHDGCITDPEYVSVYGKAIALASTMTDEEVLAILEDIHVGRIQPGTEMGNPTFAQRFNGITFLLPAGYGKIVLEVNTNVIQDNVYKSNGELHVMVENDYTPTIIKDTEGFATVSIPYAFSMDSYVLIYAGVPSSSGDAKIRRAPRITETTTSIRSLSVTAKSVDSSPQPPLTPKLLDKSHVVKTGNHVIVNDPDVNGIESDAFEGLVGEDITYIDLSGTAIKNMKVNRNLSGSPFKNLSEKTFVYLPAGNSFDTSASSSDVNMVIGSVCNVMKLDDSAPFEAAKDFLASEATQTRDYSSVLGNSCTIYLPFAIDAETVKDLGTFYELTDVTADQVKFTSVEETKAHTPYMFKPAKEALSVENAEVKKDVPAPAVVGTNAIFEGTYVQTSICSDGDTQYYCFLGESAGDDAGKFVRVLTNPVTVNPFRAYIKVTGASLAPSLDVNTDDIVTAIQNMYNVPSTMSDDGWYTLQGVKLNGKPTEKGVYIYNGKKVVIK